MHIDFVDFREELTGAVADFNRRLVRRRSDAACSRRRRFPNGCRGFPAENSSRNTASPPTPSGQVRGGYMLKHQEFRIGKDTCSIGDFQLPISEGVVNRAYAALGVGAAARAPSGVSRCSTAWAWASLSESLPRLLAASGWSLTPVPFFFRIVHPFAFLRNSVYLRRNARHAVPARRARLLADWGGSAVKLIHAVGSPAAAPSPTATSAESSRNSADWTDELWEACKDHYGMCAVRDAQTLRVLYPRDDARFIRLRVKRADRTIGWAVLLNNRWWNHKHFGRMRLGSIADCFAAPADAAGSRSLRNAIPPTARRRPDRLQPVARRLAQGPAQRRDSSPGRPISTSPRRRRLTQVLQSAGVRLGDMHWTRGDGDGPINL